MASPRIHGGKRPRSSPWMLLGLKIAKREPPVERGMKMAGAWGKPTIRCLSFNSYSRQFRRLGLVGVFLEDRLELGGVDRLAIEQEHGDLLERAPAVGEDLVGQGLGAIQHRADFQVDLAGGVLTPGVAVSAAAGEKR